MPSDRTRATAGPLDARPWRRLHAAVSSAGMPSLRVEVAPGRILLRQEGQPVLFAVRDRAYQGMWYRRVPGAYRSPIEPPRAQFAREIGEISSESSGEDERVARWAHWFWRQLAASSRGPLHGGSWLIEVADDMSRTSWSRLCAFDAKANADEHYASWIPYLLPPLLLRPLSEADSGRVKAYRKLAAAGTLPPILLWWIGGLNRDVLLDGHDRLVAAVAEGVGPRVLRLARPVAPEKLGLRFQEVTAWHEQTAAAHADVPNAARDSRWNRNLGSALEGIAATLGPTLAYPVRGGLAGWTAEAERCAPGWNPRTMA
jgi:hypothetical protein